MCCLHSIISMEDDLSVHKTICFQPNSDTKTPVSWHELKHPAGTGVKLYSAMPQRKEKCKQYRTAYKCAFCADYNLVTTAPQHSTPHVQLTSYAFSW
jgi:hypothetical protein